MSCRKRSQSAAIGKESLGGGSHSAASRDMTGLLEGDGLVWWMWLRRRRRSRSGETSIVSGGQFD